MRRSTIVMLIILAALCVAFQARGTEEPVKLPAELAEVIEAAQDDLQNGRTDEAITHLKDYSGKDHALRHLLLGHTYLRRADLSAAAAAYQKALEMDNELSRAGVALGQVYARQEKWKESSRILGQYLATDECSADMLFMYTQVSRRMDDNRLCRVLTDKGLIRFPQDGRFRRMDVNLLVEEGRYALAAESVRKLLKKSPADADLWGQLAYTQSQAGDEEGGLAALESALMCRPNDIDLHRRFLATQLAEGKWLAVVNHGKELLSGPLAGKSRTDAKIMELLIRAADRGEKDKILGNWLKLVDEKDRSRTIRIIEARLALRRGKTKDARKVLRKLIAQGQADADIFLWAGHLAERAEDWARAATLYDYARRSEGSAAQLATLYLARLRYNRGMYDRAVELLKAHLNEHPQDTTARSLLALARDAQQGK